MMDVPASTAAPRRTPAAQTEPKMGQRPSSRRPAERTRRISIGTSPEPVLLIERFRHWLVNVGTYLARAARDGCEVSHSPVLLPAPWHRGARTNGADALPPASLGSRDADGLRAAELQHPVQGTSGDGDLGRLTAVRTRPQRVPDHPLVAGDRRLARHARGWPGRCGRSARRPSRTSLL